MSLLFETIRIQDGEVKNLHYHQQRCNQTRAVLFPDVQDIELSDYINLPSYFRKGLVKCRLSYDECIRTISYEYYHPRKINSIKILKADHIAYPYKYENRIEMKKLYDQRDDNSEILMIKNGLVTDCFYYNVALYSDDWYTPEEPLLQGTMRAYLLDEGIINEARITLEDIPLYSKICLFNALNPFGNVVVDTRNIV